ncbi:hybrid sensor histidine kinase/response regulator [Leptothoe kymatousa]|uniref:histidine kinase n=1 Tax=Leptothoe kymatousa TAU-MAC 1615 TaxID=2364775 RepID=A0ABS5Y0I4_9CYAN|nr:response regulator [Leptothoe kymatousa]MBT9311357.1 response regulator [Leptothoe kymatousa TAU-MAC 1615]
MVPEQQQQRILGYFIEEAKDHLNTIEQGLLNLQATIGNPEMANEVFRAAHSVKGGAAMLGIESMQRTSHRLEDYFKLLKEAPVQVDRPLESMFLRVFDALQELLEQLQGPFGLTDEKEQSIMTGVEPVFQQLQEHLDQLVSSAEAAPVPSTVAPPTATTAPATHPVEESALKLVFSSDVSVSLREMLGRFKQADTDESRAALEECCRVLERFGEQFNLPTWLSLIQHSRWAVCDLNNDYRTLAPVLIKEVKKAQDLVLAGREPEIIISDTLQTLAAQGSASEPADDFDALFGESDFVDGDLASADTTLELDDLSVLEDASLASNEVAQPVTGEAVSLDDLLNEAAVSPSGPDVGAAELTSLADLFETNSENDLEGGWQEEDVPIRSEGDPLQSLGMDASPDFEDLLNDNSAEQNIDANDFASGDELADLFGDNDIPDSSEDLSSEFDSLTSQSESTPSNGDDQLSDSLTSIDDLFDQAPNTDEVESVEDVGADLFASEVSDLDGLGGGAVTVDDLFAADVSASEEASSEALEGVEDVGADLFASEVSDLDGLGGGADAVDDLFAAEVSASEEASGEALESVEDVGADLFASEVSDLDGLGGGADAMDDLFAADVSASEESSEEALESIEDVGADLFASEVSDLDGLGGADAVDDLFAPEVSGAEEASSEALESVEDVGADLFASEVSDLGDLGGAESAGTVDDLFNTLDGAELEAADVEDSALFDDIDAPSEDEGSLFDDIAVSPSPQSDIVFDSPAEPDSSDESNLLDGLELLDSPPSDDGSLEDGTSVLDDLNVDDLGDGLAPASEAASSGEVDDLFGDDVAQPEATSSSDDFFNTNDAGPLYLDPPAATSPASTQSDFDDFFQVDDAPATPASTADSLGDDDLWTIDNPAEAASPAAVPVDDSLSDDVWAEPDDEVANLDLSDTEAPSLAITEEASEDNLELDDLWASTEDVDEAAAQESDPVADLSVDDASVGIALDDLFDDAGGMGDVSPGQMLSEPVETAMDTPADEAAEGELGDLLGDVALTEEASTEDFDLAFDDSSSEIANGSDADLLTTPPSDELDFDLLDLEDGGIVTAFVNEEESPAEEGPSDERPSDRVMGAELDLLADLPAVAELPDLGPDIAADAAAGEVAADADEFGDLEALLDSPVDLPTEAAPASAEDEFGDLEALLQDADQTLTTTAAASSATAYRPNRLPTGRRVVTDQTMRVSVGHLDNLSNLVGELVVNRNTLEQDQERLRQFLENLLFQVQQLNDVGQRMRDLYERSLLESSLISSRQSYHMANAGVPVESAEDHATGESFDALEMDRFTGFHTLSQEMIELIVRVRESASDIAYTVESSDQVTRQFRQVTNQLQEGLNKARMVPFAQTAARLPRAVRDISLKCGKEARLVVEGRDILIDKMILEQLYDPMTHLVNNAITHGIETPQSRQDSGKSPEGLITVRAFYQGNQTVISVGDDGAGIDPEIVKQKALQKGLISKSDIPSMTVLDVYDLLFHPGFSTRDQADDFAGRGFGMDVVRTSLADIRGNITIDSEPGRGTTFTIRLPLTLSISKALSCVSNQARIAFPMDGVEDMFDVSRDRIQKNDQNEDCILWRDTLLPFQNLSDLLSFNRTLGRGRVYGGNQDENIVSIVVLRSTNSFIALQVDQVMGEQEIVIKQLEGPIPKPTGIAGATVLGDGRVMPIADVLELIDLAMGRVRREPNAAVWAQNDETPPQEAASVKSEPTVLIVDDSITVRELLSMSFNKVGYRVEQARDGQEAWEKLRSGLPCDLVFCDIEMPRMDGLELLSRLQKDGGLKEIPIAMLTSRGADRHRQMAVDLGASGYFTKPYLEEALLDAANKMLHGERLV